MWAGIFLDSGSGCARCWLICLTIVAQRVAGALSTTHFVTRGQSNQCLFFVLVQVPLSVAVALADVISDVFFASSLSGSLALVAFTFLAIPVAVNLGCLIGFLVFAFCRDKDTARFNSQHSTGATPSVFIQCGLCCVPCCGLRGSHQHQGAYRGRCACVVGGFTLS